MIKNRFTIEEIRRLCFDLQIDYDSLGGSLKADKVRELVLFMRRRNQLGELIQRIQEERPNISLDSLSREEIHLTHDLIGSWDLFLPAGQTLLFLDVGSSIVQHNDWAIWLKSFMDLGFGGVLAPIAKPALQHSAGFLEQFLKLYQVGMGVGTAVLQARQQLWQTENNPIGLYYVHYGSPEMHVPEPTP